MGVRVPPPTRVKVLVRCSAPANRGSRHTSLVPSWTQIGHGPFGPVSSGHGHGWAWPRMWAGGESLVLPDRPSTRARWQATAEARQRLRQSVKPAGLGQSKVEIDTGRLRHGARRTVADLAAEWLEAVHPNRKASTFSNYGWLMRAMWYPGLEGFDWIASRLISRSCTPSCAARAVGEGALAGHPGPQHPSGPA